MSHAEETADAKYLGDGLYVAGRVGDWELFASNGFEKTNRVFLEVGSMGKLLQHLKAQGIDLAAIR